MAENSRPVYSAHSRILHAHLGEKGVYYNRSCNPDMTYNVFGGTLNLAQSINQSCNGNTFLILE